MNTHPILMSGEMVRALLAGRKTQTRRILKLPRGHRWYDSMGGESKGWFCDDPGQGWWHIDELRCPYGKPGDLLWVRETYAYWSPRVIYYPATKSCSDGVDRPHYTPGKLRPSIHMPRSASRLTLKLTEVRVERLNDISPEDAAAEGWPGPDELNSIRSAYPIAWYSHLWEQINGTGSWAKNPWVWALSFQVEKSNVDELLSEGPSKGVTGQ